MKIKELTTTKKKSYGSCTECGISVEECINEGMQMFRIYLGLYGDSSISVTLCEKCVQQIVQMIKNKMQEEKDN